MNYAKKGPCSNDGIARKTKQSNPRSHHKNRLAARTVAAALSLFGLAQIPANAGVLAKFDSTVKFAESPRFVVEVTGNNPTGHVKIYGSPGMFYEIDKLHIVGDYILCKAPVLDGKAVCALNPRLDYLKEDPKDDPAMGLKAVPYYWNVRAEYSGDANNPPASHTVKQLIDYKAIHLSGTAVPPNPMAGQDVVLSALVRTGDIAGSITFSRAGTPISGCANVAVAGLPEAKFSTTPGQVYTPTTGIATCTVKAIEAGTQSFGLAYAGNVGARTQSAVMNVRVRGGGAGDHSGMYWNPAESGWGMSVVQHGDKQMNVIYGYDQIKSARWYVMPTGTWNGSNTVYTGSLYQPTSAPYDSYNAKSFKANEPIGEAVITYSPSGAVTLAYLINGDRGSKALTKISLGSNDSKTRLSVADMWWGGEDDASEYGWGVSIAQEGNQLFPVWFTYDAQGKATWFPLMRAPENYASFRPPVFHYDYGWYANRFSTHVYSLKASMAPSDSFLPNSLITELTGTVNLTFQDQESAIMAYPVPCEGEASLNACLQSKKLRRQKF